LLDRFSGHPSHVNEVSVLVGFGAMSLRNWLPDVSRQRTGLIFKGRFGHFDPLKMTSHVSKRQPPTLPSDAAFFILRRRYLKETKEAEFL
jgi:hypothetical protein